MYQCQLQQNGIVREACPERCCRLRSSLGFVHLSFPLFLCQHTSICEFPSQEFYGRRLRTCPQLVRKPSVLHHRDNSCCPIIFGHVEGKEHSLMISTEEGNENSRANLEEVAHAVSRVLGNCWGCTREGVVLESWRDDKRYKHQRCLPGASRVWSTPGRPWAEAGVGQRPGEGRWGALPSGPAPR